jgi:DnaJ-class molecular chaperone
MKAGSKFKFAGIGDEIEGTKQDIHFIVTEKPHPLFQRKDNDLIATISIPLKDALTGWSRQIKTIDGKTLQVSHSGPTPPNWTETYPSLGMVLPKEPNQRGNLIVKVNVSAILLSLAARLQFLTKKTLDCIPCFALGRTEEPVEEHSSLKLALCFV